MDFVKEIFGSIAEVKRLLVEELKTQRLLHNFTAHELDVALRSEKRKLPLIFEVEKNPLLFTQDLEQALIVFSIDSDFNFGGIEVQNKINNFLKDQTALEAALKDRFKYEKEHKLIMVNVSLFDADNFEKEMKKLEKSELYKDSYEKEEEVQKIWKRSFKEGSVNMISPHEWASMHVHNVIMDNL